MSKIAHSFQKCPVCGKEHSGEDSLCTRCQILQALLGEQPNCGNLASTFWEFCFACEEEIIAKVDLTPESLVIQCDGCGEIHEIPFKEEDLCRYIRSGIVREMVADEYE